jgi:GntR family transcriptional repressor for pyruvate dehydrogenase complex
VSATSTLRSESVGSGAALANSGSGNFQPVERMTVSAEIRTRLLEAIRKGELAPGSPLPAERLLCLEFGVARTSVREAIQGLMTAGYLVRRGNRPVVADHLPGINLGGDDRKALVSQLFEVRRVIEPAMAEFAALRATDADRQEIAALAALSPKQLDEFRRIDREFHTALARACGNPVLHEVHSKALAALFSSGEFTSLLYAEVNRSAVSEIIRSATEAHRAIAAAIVRGDGRGTAECVEQHLSDIERRMVERLA